jgi:hypothetical protein
VRWRARPRGTPARPADGWKPEPMTAAAVACPADAGVADPSATSLRPSLAALLAGHILRDGETVVMILKPSLWFIVLAALRFAAAAAVGVLAAKLWLSPLGTLRALEAGIFLVAGRVMWATLQWMGRLYVLTDWRVIRLAGVFNIDIFDCPLRRVSQVRLWSPFKERILGVGSIEIIAADGAVGDWRTVKHPRRALEKIERMVESAKHNGMGSLSWTS